ncbi:fused MFS/spermidine synthase [Xanthobacter aminoxidans]|uniref:fused MFS/spermidine synthase n=1 Tax=Xanthobacter aminoxidans TaxID=186280 RepID=UPI00372CCDF0
MSQVQASEPESAAPQRLTLGRNARTGIAIVLVATLSGFAGLGYEIVWTRMLAVSLGHELVAVLGVISALFGGLALGSLLLGRAIAGSRRPAAWYAGLELVIGAWALVLIGATPLFGDLVPALVPVDASALRQWSVAFALPFVLLLPATLAMGATLPALEAVLAPRLASGAAVGHVYAANTFGAVAGTLATAFLIIPAVGLSATLMLCALLNAVCAAAMLAVARDSAPAARPIRAPETGPASLPVLAPLFLTGLLGIGYEVLTVRVLSQILENTIYTFAVLLACYLAGTALGAALYTRWRSIRGPGADGSVVLLVTLTALACLAGAALLGASGQILSALKATLPVTVAGRLSAELAMAAVAFLPPTIAMGALFTALAQRASDRLGGVGPGLAANTLGAALAPMLFGPVLLPLIGAKYAFALLAAAYVLALPLRSRAALAGGGLTLAVTLALVLAPVSLRFVQVPEGGALEWHRDGVMAAVSVVRNAAGDHHLQVNNHFRMGGSASMRSDHRQAHIPLLLHPNPRSALFLGLGTGATLSAAGDHPGLRIEGVELVPEVVESFPYFERTPPRLAGNPDIRIHVADARRFVRAGTAPYDVIVADLYHPSVDGSGALYAREHFAAIRDRLAPDGLFCQWLPLHQLDMETLKVIVRTFLDVFPDTTAWLAQFSVETPLVALIGRRAPAVYPADWVERRVRDRALATGLKAVDMDGSFALFGLHLAGPADLARFAGNAPLNTDDRPVVTASAPGTAYAASERPADRLVALLATLHPAPQTLLAGADPATQARLSAYWKARDGYIGMGARALAAKGPRDVIGTLAPQLIELVRISPDFEAAYAPVLAMARQLAVTDPSGARRLLEALDRANPSRPDARRLLAQLPPA